MDHITDAALYSMTMFSPTGREVNTKANMGESWMGKSNFMQAWSGQLANEIRRTSFFIKPLIGIFDDFTQPLPEGAIEMHAALKELKSKHLPAYIQMSAARKGAFIKRVERHGQKQYPNQQHMREIYAAYINKRVFNALKD